MIKTAQNTTWPKAGGRGGGMSWEVALKHFLALSEAGPDTDDGAGACQRCWMLDRTIFSPKFLNSVPYPSPAVQFRCLLTFGESVASRIHRAEQQPALFFKFFFFFTQCYSKSFIFFLMYKFVHRTIVLLDTIYLILNTNLCSGCVSLWWGCSAWDAEGGKFVVSMEIWGMVDSWHWIQQNKP